MTRGTIIVIGATSRETDLLAKRLEKEHFTLVLLPTAQSASHWLRLGTAQAVLLTKAASRREVESTLRQLKSQNRHRGVPAILVADSDVPPAIAKLTGIGECFLLHETPLTELIDRLGLAIELTQMSRQLTA